MDAEKIEDALVAIIEAKGIPGPFISGQTISGSFISGQNRGSI